MSTFNSKETTNIMQEAWGIEQKIIDEDEFLEGMMKCEPRKNTLVGLSRGWNPTQLYRNYNNPL